MNTQFDESNNGGEKLLSQLVQMGGRSLGPHFIAEVFRTQLVEEDLKLSNLSADTKNKILKSLISSQNQGNHEELVEILVNEEVWPIALDFDTALCTAQWMAEKCLAQSESIGIWRNPLIKLTSQIAIFWAEKNTSRSSRLRLVNFAKFLHTNFKKIADDFHPIISDLVNLNTIKHEECVESILEINPGQEHLLSKIGKSSHSIQRNQWKMGQTRVLSEVLGDATLPTFSQGMVLRWSLEGSLRSCIEQREKLAELKNILLNLVGMFSVALASVVWDTMTAEIDNIKTTGAAGGNSAREGLEQEIAQQYLAVAKAFLFKFCSEQKNRSLFWESFSPSLRGRHTTTCKNYLSREDLAWFEMLCQRFPFEKVNSATCVWTEGLGRPPIWLHELAADLTAIVLYLAPGYWIELYGSYLIETLYKTTKKPNFKGTTEHIKFVQYLIQITRQKSKSISSRIESMMAQDTLGTLIAENQIQLNDEILRREQKGLLQNSTPFEIWKKHHLRNGQNARAEADVLNDKIQTSLFLFLCSLQSVV